MLLFLSFWTCKKNVVRIPEHSAVYDLASPIQLGNDTTRVYLTDYFLYPEKIRKIIPPSNLKLIKEKGKKEILLIPEKDMKAMENIRFQYEGYTYDIPVLRSVKKPVVFTFDPQGKQYRKVQLVGDMNAWNPENTNLELKDGVWQTTLYLAPGQYSYLVVLDGSKQLDPGNKERIDNNMGGSNSLLRVGEKAGKVPEIFTDRVSKDTVFLFYQNAVEEWFVYIQNQRLGEKYLISSGNTLGIVIPEDARELKRSELRVWAINEYGVSNDIFVPLEKGKVIEKASLLNRFDKRASRLYFLMIDRFKDAEAENNHPLDTGEVLPLANYMGGDIAGVTQKLKEGYFDSLGINTIWLSPITQNPEGAYGFWKDPKTKFSGYHGYWPVSSSKVDYRYGTSQELKDLIEEAHKRNINVILDYVANHVHEEHPLYKQHQEWATELYLPDGSLNTERWDDHRLTTWFDTFLPTLNLENPEVYEPMTDSALFWIKEYNLDGFRHDATKHIPEIFWRTLTYKLKKDVMFPKNITLYQVGETYGSRELIASYVGSGQMDGQFDFNVYDDAVATFARPDVGFQRLNNSLEESFHYYGVHNMMSYISGNQDRARFISYAAGDISFEEDSKIAGWKRKVGERKPSDETAYDKLIQLIAFNATIPGIPVLYYGDEIGMTGGNDPDNRRMMRFQDLSEGEKMVKEKTAALMKFRKSSMALMYGDFIPLRVENKVYAYLRSYFGQDVVVVFNKEPEEVTLKLDLPQRDRKGQFKALFEGRFSYDNSKLIVDVPANGIEIIYN
ncbi:alpha-amylase family glycosyl hydrolase [Odoribacter laneus]|uniref:alpha-amylase family glycosyl hydrolase n=1 Tax=Odoribacter laneus TaxID=626933 RepID=UPI001899B032|nr:alpha-amylase family glycosyl hydrolase [Odoribacter laneus]